MLENIILTVALFIFSWCYITDDEEENYEYLVKKYGLYNKEEGIK